jgi:Flp pilus assembly protein TadG
MRVRSLLRNDGGAGAAEFALVLPLLILLIFGIIDVGRWLWTYNQAEKATQMGARFAVVADATAGDNATTTGIYASYLNVGGLTQGDPIPPGAFGKVTCTSSGCTCTTTPCPGLGTANGAAFTNVVDRMRAFLPQIAPGNVTIEYSSSGLGYAGDPNGADLAPLVTVRLSGLQFQPIVALALVTMNMPDFHSSLTFEDGVGAQSN